MLFSRIDDVVVVVDYPSWEPRFQTKCPDAFTGALSADGRFLATSYRGDVKVYDVESRRLVAESLGQHQETITDVRFGPQDQWIATTSDDRIVKKWNPWNGSEPELIGVHPNGVPRGLSIASDGRTLLTDSRHGAIWASPPDRSGHRIAVRSRSDNSPRPRFCGPPGTWHRPGSSW